MAHGRQRSSLSVATGLRRRCSAACEIAAIGLRTSRAAAHVGGSIDLTAKEAERSARWRER